MADINLLMKCLREHQGENDPPWMACIMDEAADEIERLLARIEILRSSDIILTDEIARLRQENERLRRLLWLIVKSNGGYTLERHDIEQWPGADRGEVVTMEDPTTGNFVFSAVTNGDRGGTT